ncbi:hypothetical protein LGT36_006990 [Demequina sp. TMPB413]|uniref:hypothetical protein n=1 Tax=Demequina sp. TMPB413 TaxID=2881056 RepID=UPI001CF21FF9|nr:hypothetical protein [Demequina sp. TMPB413]UPU89666.1 hypothetical protein LGT36_006990 [Demequina sp. TMPB413]
MDEWSDHDFAVVVIPGAEVRYRGTTDWMPQPERVVLVLGEHHGGGKAMYDDGHFIEWGVATLDSLATWAAEDYAVLFDRGGVAQVMERVASTPFPSNVPHLRRDSALFLTALLHGVGRARRGEILSAGSIIRGDGVQTLLRAVRARSADASPALDRLDGLRRVEQAFSDLAREIADAVAQAPEPAARALLAVADRYLGVGPEGLNPAGREAVVRRLGWSTEH